ncbi:hypothetical protein CASFOL_027774 [Castilleja foliolosa]|uniref:F-box domain-containing protein n=1 Tax=Castilleja foliolosa TaxID=1961234 RepID=A0ABD3CGK6_9LAMI
MPPKRNHRQKNNKPPISGAGSGAMADCVLPQDIMFNIVTRLPVKSIHRFKAVCKPWCNLFATPKFMKSHHAQLSQNPKNQSLLIYSFFDEKGGNTMSLCKIEPIEEKPIHLDHPYPKHLYESDFVGCCNGLVCLAYPMHLHPMPGQWIELWNPALNLSKSVPFQNFYLRGPTLVSIGFGYDDEKDDFKLVRIVHVMDRKRNQGKKAIKGVQVYSANSNCWVTISVGFQFSVLMTKNQAIVNGNPYWVGKVEEKNVLVMFDVRKMVFKTVPLTGLNLSEGEHAKVPFVDWKGSIAAFICKKNDERVLSLDVWVFDSLGKIWIKNRSFGPMELKVDRIVQCLKNGGILVGDCFKDGKVFVLDADDDEENGVSVKKEIVIDRDVDEGLFQIYGYTESLAYIKGMEKVKAKPKRGNDWGKKIEDFFGFLEGFKHMAN